MTGSVHLSASIIAVVPQSLQLNLKKKSQTTMTSLAEKVRQELLQLQKYICNFSFLPLS